MDREKERREQEEFNAQLRRRSKRALLRTYIQAHVEMAQTRDAVDRGILRAVIDGSKHQLKLLRFTRFSVLRAHAKKISAGEATMKKPF